MAAAKEASMNADPAYSDSLTLRQARERFFARSGLPPDGGYSARWVRIEAKPFPFYFPNTASRMRSVRLHDLHHIATGYATDWPGEIEIGAWEIGGSCARHPAAWILNAGAMAVGVFGSPRRMWRAFVRGRHTRNLYRSSFDQISLDRTTVGSLRAQLGLDSAQSNATASDVLVFLGWCAALLMVSLSVVAAAAGLARRIVR
jgi:hypothetical protein